MLMPPVGSLEFDTLYEALAQYRENQAHFIRLLEGDPNVTIAEFERAKAKLREADALCSRFDHALASLCEDEIKRYR